MKDKNLIKIVEYCNWLIENISTVKSFDEFVNNEALVYSSSFLILQIAEHAKKLSKEIKEKCNIDWKRIIGMRNVIVHNYEGIIQDTLYETLVEDIPLLLEELLK
ncbi:MAG: DUF86 domain-containing protein [Bacilli bacterium]|nr:DUF86 domain-containing protein [Bacilli bacterium]